MGHYDCKYCDASPGEEHSADCERFQPMTNPNHTDTSRSGDLVERLRDEAAMIADDVFQSNPETLDDAADRIEALEAENERLRGTVRGLIALVIDAGLTDDLVAQLYPDAKRKNGQPACDFAKRVRRTINEARAALGEKQ